MHSSPGHYQLRDWQRAGTARLRSCQGAAGVYIHAWSSIHAAMHSSPGHCPQRDWRRVATPLLQPCWGFLVPPGCGQGVTSQCRHALQVSNAGRSVGWQALVAACAVGSKDLEHPGLQWAPPCPPQLRAQRVHVPAYRPCAELHEEPRRAGGGAVRGVCAVLRYPDSQAWAGLAGQPRCCAPLTAAPSWLKEAHRVCRERSVSHGRLLLAAHRGHLSTCWGT